MNQVEMMGGQLAALSRRVAALEKVARSQAAAGADSVQAGKVAQEIGFPVEILVLPMNVGGRKKLAARLKADGWSHERISRVLNCSEKSVRRWLA